MNSDSHVKTFTEISPLEALKALAESGKELRQNYAFRYVANDVWHEGCLAGARFGEFPFIDINGASWSKCARVTLAPKIADGHNPDKLTVDQVGVNEGWRLLTKEEHESRPKAAHTQYWLGEWSCTREWHTQEESLRTKQPAGFYLQPSPPALKPWDFSSAPRGLVAITNKGNRESFFYVCGMGQKGITGPRISYDWQDLADKYEHSTDFVNWKPCGTA